VALDALEVGGKKVDAGEVITVSLLAAGHDPGRHADADRFNIERADTSHLAFGGGAHFCLGAPLARAEPQIAIPLLFERFPDLRLDPQHAIEHKHAPVFNGLTALWVRAA
jgi:cytochrome P450